jgi:hypothetical protein
MPTILELFKDPSKFQFGTNYESAVKDDKNIIETIASKTSKIRRQTGVDLNNPLIYGTGTIRIANRTLQTTEFQKSARFDDGTTEPASGGGLLGDGLSKLSGGKINSLSEARDELSSKLGLPSKLIPSKIVSDKIFLDGYEQDTISTLETIKNNGEGSDLGKFLKQTGGGNPKTIGRESVGGGIGIVKDKVRNAAFGEPQTLREVTGQKLQDNYSSTQKYSEISQDGDSLRDYKNEGGDTNIKFANQSTDVINLDEVSPVNRIDRDNTYSVKDGGTSLFRGFKTLKERGFADLSKTDDIGDTLLLNGPNDDYTKDEMVDNQLIPFWVSGLNSSKPIFFRTTVSGITENVSPSWGSSKFIGNPYNFYTYSGVERSVSMNLSIYCNNPRELAKNWEKIEYLTSKTYPSINKDLSFVDAPFVKFRLGNIYNEKIAFIESLTYTVPDNSNWETEIDGLYLPKLIDVAISFKFIEQEGSENALYNYARNEEAIQQIQTRQTQYEDNRTSTTVTRESGLVPGINTDGTRQDEPPTKPLSNKTLDGGKSVDENNQDEVKKSTTSSNLGSDKKVKYQISISGNQETGFSAFVFVQGKGEAFRQRYPKYMNKTKEDIKNELRDKASTFGFFTGKEYFEPSDDITFS